MDLADNPFFMLDLDATAGALDVERQGKRLLAELELDRAHARIVTTPFGERPRDATRVREAMAALRDPRARAIYARFVPPRDAWPSASPDDERQEVARYPEVRSPLARADAALSRALRIDGVRT